MNSPTLPLSLQRQIWGIQLKQHERNNLITLLEVNDYSSYYEHQQPVASLDKKRN